MPIDVCFDPLRVGWEQGETSYHSEMPSNDAVSSLGLFSAIPSNWAADAWQPLFSSTIGARQICNVPVQRDFGNHLPCPHARNGLEAEMVELAKIKLILTTFTLKGEQKLYF